MSHRRVEYGLPPSASTAFAVVSARVTSPNTIAATLSLNLVIRLLTSKFAGPKYRRSLFIALNGIKWLRQLLIHSGPTLRFACELPTPIVACCRLRSVEVLTR